MVARRTLTGHLVARDCGSTSRTTNRHIWSRSALIFLAAWTSSISVAVPGPLEKRPSVLLVVVDTLRFDGASPDRARAYSPIPPMLRSHGHHFVNAMAAGNWTTPSITALMTGRYASESGIVTDQPEASRPAGWTLGERLRSRGYATAAVVANPFLFGAGLHLEPGFESVDARMPGQEPNRKVGRRSATDTTDAALAELGKLARDPRPHFLWVHYLEPHGPYLAPERWQRLADTPGTPIERSPLDSPGKGLLPNYQFLAACRGRNDYRARYEGAAAYALAEVERFLSSAAAAHLLENTIVVFTSDHGEFLGEENYWFQHGARIHPAVVHVPLVIATSLAEPLSVDERLVSNVDVLPTLLARLGLERDAGLEGEDLFAPAAKRRHPILTEYVLLPSRLEMGIVVNDRLVVRSNREPPTAFRLSGGRWPACAIEEKVVREATELLRPILNRIQRTTIRSHPFSPEEINQLRALGYLGGRD